jgi:hypothetical protein
VPETRSATIRGTDPVGQLLAVGSLFGLVFVLIESPDRGWTHPWIQLTAAAAALTFVAFLRYESRHPNPFIELRLFRSVPFAAATATALSVFTVWGAFLFMMSIYLQGWRGYCRWGQPSWCSHRFRAGWSAGPATGRRCCSERSAGRRCVVTPCR